MSDDTEIREWIKGHRLVAMPPLQPRVYEVTDTLVIGASMGLCLCGSGSYSRSNKPGWDPYRCHTRLVWKGPAGKPFVALEGCSCFAMEGLNFEGADTGLVLSHGRTGSLQLSFHHCSWIGQRIGTQWGTAFGESTCANIKMQSCYFEGQDSAYLSVNGQSVEHALDDVKFAYCRRCIDLQGGGGLTVQFGGPYQCQSFLHLGRIGSNARGFLVQRVRFDGKNLRQSWLSADDTDKAQAYGTITFSNCTQNQGQSGNTSQPLVTVPPGARVILRDCSFNGGYENWAKVYGNRDANGELSVQDCDGISVTQFEDLVEVKSAKAYYEFLRCGSIWGPRGDFSTFPAEGGG